MGYLLFALFIIVPLLEIAAFIEIGSLIGLLPTLAGIVLTAVIGAFLVRRQGFQVLEEARQSAGQHRSPIMPLVHGLFILVAGLLLLTPGFVTDAIGFIFLIPAARSAIAAAAWKTLRSRIDVTVMRPGPGAPGGDPYDAGSRPGDRGGPVIEGEAEEVGERETGRRRDDSPWNAGHRPSDRRT